MYRQGDILIVPVSEEAVPAPLRARRPSPRGARGRLVLALGEATGHAHAVIAPGSLLRDAAPGSPDYLHLPSGGRVVHEEHAAISLPAGWFRIVRQREYVPGSVRVVSD